MDEGDFKTCQQCASLRESLRPCDGGCGREICSYCGPKCKNCIDQETYDQIRQEKREEKQEKKEAEKKTWEPERTLPEKVWRAMDWVFGMADGALKRELELYDGEFENYSFEDLQDVMRTRYRQLPAWKKKLYKVKKKSEDLAIKTAIKTVTKGTKIIGELGREDLEDDETSDDGKYF